MSSNMLPFCLNHLQRASSMSKNHRYRFIVNYVQQHTDLNITDNTPIPLVFFMDRMLPEDGLAKPKHIGAYNVFIRFSAF